MSALSPLRMRFTRFATLIAPLPAAGYTLRTFRPGDEGDWVKLLTVVGFGAGNRAWFGRLLEGDDVALDPEGVHFVFQDRKLVGTASVFVHSADLGDISELALVAVHPAHRGKRLGLSVCAAALQFCSGRGHLHTFVRIEDHRLAAIKTFLHLGFEPEAIDREHSARWSAVARALAAMVPQPFRNPPPR